MRKAVMALGWLTLAGALGAGCFGDDVIACDFRGDDDRCQDRTGLQAANPVAFQATCETAAGRYLSDGCPREGIVAGCDITSPGSTGSVIDWYYAPTTVADVDRECEGDGEVVPP